MRNFKVFTIPMLITSLLTCNTVLAAKNMPPSGKEFSTGG